jgi:hypothetical protein
MIMRAKGVHLPCEGTLIAQSAVHHY